MVVQLTCPTDHTLWRETPIQLSTIMWEIVDKRQQRVSGRATPELSSPVNFGQHIIKSCFVQWDQSNGDPKAAQSKSTKSVHSVCLLVERS